MNRHHVSLRALTVTGLLITAALLLNGQTKPRAGDPAVDLQLIRYSDLTPAYPKIWFKTGLNAHPVPGFQVNVGKIVLPAATLLNRSRLVCAGSSCGS